MNYLERPFFRLLGVFFALGLLAWWTFRFVSLPPSLRKLWDEDQAIAEVTTPRSEEEQIQAERNKLPAPPENHAPPVADLLERIKNLPPVPYSVLAARQRDRSARPGGETVPWSQEELSELDGLLGFFTQAWKPFLSQRQIAWERHPDSVRIFRSQLEKLLGTPPDYDCSDQFLLDPQMSLYNALRGLGALRFGYDLLLQNGWAALDTVALASSFSLSILEIPPETETGSAPPLPEAPGIEDLRAGLRSDRALFLSASDYLASLPPETSARAALDRFLNSREHAPWLLAKIPEVKTSSQLADHFRKDADQILSLENKTFLSGPAWRQWLAGNPEAGLSPTLRGSLDGLRDFESVRIQYLVSSALVQARAKIRKEGIEAAKQLPDPAAPGNFLQITEREGKITISSVFRPAGSDANGLSIELDLEGASADRP